MPFSQTILIQPDGWGWAANSDLHTSLRQLVSGLNQARANVLRVVDHVPSDMLWRAAGPHIPTIGSLLRHLAGTEHQWIGNKVGQLPLQRNRDIEFNGINHPSLNNLLAAWDQIRIQTDVIVGQLAARADEPTPEHAFCFHYTAQHFSYHCGQIVTIRKIFDPAYSVYPPMT